MNIEDDIVRLERGIRVLKIQYDQYFAGALARQPLDLRGEMETLIRKYSNAPIRRLAERFHFNTLVSRFNSLAELYENKLRAKEEGRPFPGLPVPRSEEEEGEERQVAAQDGNGSRVLHQQLLRGPGDGASLRDFYDKFLEVRRSQGHPAQISFSSFERQILRKSEAVKNRASCDAVRLRLTLVGDRVQLKAVPVRRRKTE